MAVDTRSGISRRQFVQQTGLAAGGLLLGSQAVEAAAADSPKQELPRRVLGKTGATITTLTLGTACCGSCKDVTVKQIAELVNVAIDMGVNSIDTARLYGKAEEGVGQGLGRRRKEVFLATKLFCDTAEQAEKSLAESFRLLKTDYVDLLYLQNLGARKVEETRKPDGAFTWLLKQKQAGKTRFVGVSAHSTPDRCLPFFETGQVDVFLAAVNFVDRHTYNFEERVLPEARKRNLGIVAMKVFGGLGAGFKGYGGAAGPALVPHEYLELAVRYALHMPGVASVNIGPHTPQQLLQNAAWVANGQPLSEKEQAMLARVGRDLAPKWGEHFGPVKA